MVFNIKVKILRYPFLLASISLCITSCTVNRDISKQASAILLEDSVLSKGHIGISIYDPAEGKYLYNHNETKYFIPASNTKLFTLYAGMHLLGDSLTGLRYLQLNDTIYAMPSADPGFMHPDFPYQPVTAFFDSLKSPLVFSSQNWKAEKYGSGWAWDDYNDSYMPERNALPVHGNLVTTSIHHIGPSDHSANDSLLIIEPKIGGAVVTYHPNNSLESAIIQRNPGNNHIDVSYPDKTFSILKDLPFVTNGINTALEILHTKYPLISQQEGNFNIPASKTRCIYTQPSDSLFRIMMHNSDNFYAEQILLMASDGYLGYMSDKAIIDTLLKTTLATVPQKPKWIDGSGLSRYNLFTPQSFIYILTKLKDEFGMERLKMILPAGGEGSLKNYFRTEGNTLFAKTGTLSNNASLSGFLVTQKGKLLIFCIIANNYPSKPGPARASFEKFLLKIIKNF